MRLPTPKLGRFVSVHFRFRADAEVEDTSRVLWTLKAELCGHSNLVDVWWRLSEFGVHLQSLAGTFKV
jgi:hypothetical protein